MKKLIFLMLCCVCVSCVKYSGVPQKYKALLDSALVKAGENQLELTNALKSASPEEKEGMAFLISYMPESDLKTIKCEDLLTNVQLAYKARNSFEWAKSVPDSIFFNDVLPYISLDETRENWRTNLHTRFSSYVKDCKTMEEAIKAVNKNIRDELKVDYDTRREKPNQSPSESIRQGMASCTGLSILLTDAFRAVGIPSRIAGAASWHDNRGNHNWCEVWLDGQWRFTEYYPDELDRSWFLIDAAKADPNKKLYAIWATSFKPTGESFPMVWSDAKNVPALNVTQRYIEIYNQLNEQREKSGDFVKLKIMMLADNRCTANSGDRVETNVDVFCGKEQIGGGSTAGPTQDMNDVFELLVEKNREYTLNYSNKAGQWVSKKVKVEAETVVVKLYMQE